MSPVASIEVMVLPVTDVDATKAFYLEDVGFGLDVDYRPSEEFRVVQITPPGSACSIQLVAAEGSVAPRETYLVVEDIAAAREDLRGRGVEVGALRRKEPREGWAGDMADGRDPDRADYATFAEFADPDGHLWVLQERRAPEGESPSPDR